MIDVWAFEYNYLQGRDVPLEAYEDAVQVQQAFDDTLARLSGLEAIGFTGAFLGEHHFMNALSPAPNLILAALSQRTKTLRMGVMGNVLAMHQPWRLVEDLGMLDYLTEGRLEIGMASGVPPEFSFLDIPQDEVRARYAEALEILELAARQPRLTYSGKFYNYDEVPLFPKLRPEPRRRRWVTLFSPETARHAAAHGHKICTAFKSPEDIRAVVEVYYEEAARRGARVGPEDVGLRRQVLICESDQQAEDLNDLLLERATARLRKNVAPVAERVARKGGSFAEAVKKTGIVDADAPVRSNGKVTPVQGGIVSMEHEYIFGSPKTVAEKLIDQCRRTGAGNLMAHHSPALERDEVERLYREFWPQVVPALSKATISGPPA